MDERERRKKQLAEARRLIARVQRARLAKAGDRADPKDKLAMRILEKGMPIAKGGKPDRLLHFHVEELRRRMRRNEPAWSVDSAIERVSREIAKGAAGRGRHARTLGMGDPTTDYDEPPPPGAKKPVPGRRLYPADYGSRLRSAGRRIRKSRSSKF